MSFVHMKLEIDEKSASERFVGSGDMYAKYLFKFPYRANYNEAINYLKNGDLENAFIEFHSFRGACANLSLTKLHKLVSRTVETLRLSKIPSEEDLKDLQEAYDNTIEAILDMEKNNIKVF